MKQNKILASFFIVFFSVLIIASCGKGDSTPPPTPTVLPVLSVTDASTARIATSTSMRFYVSLNKASSSIVTVDYILQDGTAASPRDYAAASGTISIPANQTSTSVEVIISGDPTNVRQPNLEFTIALSNPKNCTLSATSAKGTIVTEDGTFLSTDNTGYTTPTSYPGYTLTWSDEFSGSTLNLSDWNQEIGNGTGGWGNNELEYYTNSTKNTFVSNGNLIIEARKESIGGFNYSSGRMTTQNKKTFKFGRIDIRAKLPVTKGMWPALWMLGSNISSVGWPQCGEMDIMELVGSNPNRSVGTLHWKNTANVHASKGANYFLPSGDFSQQFHVFSMIWVQDLVKIYVDDQLYVTVAASDISPAFNPFNADLFFIFNVAVGGDWPGPPDASTNFPQRMFVDYVRVFQ